MNFELPPDFVNSVLSQTSGKVCESAEDRLPPYVDGYLDEGKHDMVSLHLEECSDCRSLEGALRRLEVDLKTLAEVSPEPVFFGEVIAATSQAPRRFEAIAAAWRRLVARPRFAYEFAYVGTMALVLIMWIGGFGSIGNAAAQLARSAPVETLAASNDLAKDTTQETSRLAGMLKNLVAGGVRDGVESGLNLVDENTQALSNRAAVVSQWTDDKWTGLTGRLIQSDDEPADETDN